MRCIYYIIAYDKNQSNWLELSYSLKLNLANLDALSELLFALPFVFVKNQLLQLDAFLVQPTLDLAKTHFCHPFRLETIDHEVELLRGFFKTLQSWRIRLILVAQSCYPPSMPLETSYIVPPGFAPERHHRSNHTSFVVKEDLRPSGIQRSKTI